MIARSLAFLLGVVLLYQFISLPSLSWCWLLLIIFPAIFFRFRLPLILLLVIASGFLWALLRAHLVLDVVLPGQLQSKDVMLTGVVASIPFRDDRKTRFEFDVEDLSFQNKEYDFPARIRISWFHTVKNPAMKHLKAGQRWKLWVRLKHPHGFANPGGFDFEGWMYSKAIRATGYVRHNAKQNQVPVMLNEFSRGYTLLYLRQVLHDRMQTLLDDMPNAGLLTALSLGERGQVDSSEWQTFRATGTSHLMAISGMHIGFLAGFIFFLIRKTWARSEYLALRVASPKAAALGAILAGVVYAALSGFAVPAQRAMIMLLTVMVAVIQQRQVNTFRLLSIALLFVLIFDPSAVLSAGFWLSFFAVFVIVLIAAGRVDNYTSIVHWLRLQWRISLLLIPLLLFLFQQASLISPLANLLAIPVVGFFVVPLTLLALFLLMILPEVSILLFELSDSLLHMLMAVLTGLEALPFSQWHLAIQGIIPMALALIGGLLLLSPRGWPGKWLGIIMCVPIFWPNYDQIKAGEIGFTLLDVGQGLAAVVRTQNHVLLFDTGAKFSDRFNAGEAVVLPYLRHRGVNQVDRMIISHEDNDHQGGVASIRRFMPVKSTLASYPLKDSELCRAGQYWEWDRVIFRMLHPTPKIVSDTSIKRNNRSCVLHVSSEAGSILLPADIEKKAEKKLITGRFRQYLKSDILVIPHHGSKTSSMTTFIEQVKPSIGLIPAGMLNRYRLPHKDVVKRYQQLGIDLYSSASSGAIEVHLSPAQTDIRIQEYRKTSRRFWHIQK